MDIKVRVKLFGPPRVAVGRRQVEMVLPPGTTVAGLLDRLQEAYPVLRPHICHCSPLVNRANLDAQAELHDGDEVACLPRVSGG